MVDPQRVEPLVVHKPAGVDDGTGRGEREGQQDGSPPGQPPAATDNGTLVPCGLDRVRVDVKIAVAIARGGHASTR